MLKAILFMYTALVFWAAACESCIDLSVLYNTSSYGNGANVLLSSLREQNLLSHIVSLWLESQQNGVESGLDSLYLPCACSFLFGGAIKLSKMWPVKKWNIVQRVGEFFWAGGGWAESCVCVGRIREVFRWRRGEPMMMDRHGGDHPPPHLSIKAAGMSNGLVRPGTLS